MYRLISTYMPYSARTEYSVFNLFGSQHLAHALHRPIPAPEPHPEPNPEPDTALGCAPTIIAPSDHGQHHHTAPTLGCAPTIIAPSDWDTLFQAVLERLENCVNGQPANTAPPLPDPHSVTKTTVLECAAAMKQLHAALALERQQR